MNITVVFREQRQKKKPKMLRSANGYETLRPRCFIGRIGYGSIDAAFLFFLIKGNSTMKQKLLTRLVIGAFAGVALVGVAEAGQIQSSSVLIAREAIPANDLAIVAPSVAYRFQGDVDARTQDQQFQVKFTLQQGTFHALDAAALTALKQNFSISDGLTGQILYQSTSGNAPVNSGVFSWAHGWYTVDHVGLSSDKKTVFVTFTVKHNNGTSEKDLVKQALIGFNASTNIVGPGGNLTADPVLVDVAVSRAKIENLYDVVGDVTADYPGSCLGVRNLRLSVEHYIGLQNPSLEANINNASPDEHGRPGSTNEGTLITFPTNVLVNVVAAKGDASLAPGSRAFAGSSGGTWTTLSVNSYVSAGTANLGVVHLTQNAIGYDANLLDRYLLAGNAGNQGVDGVGVAAQGWNSAAGAAGILEVSSADVVVTASQGFAVGSVLTLDSAPNCAGTVYATSPAVTDAKAPVKLSIPTGSITAAFGANGLAPVYVCYTNAANNVIPSSSFSAVATLTKASNLDPVNLLREQNNVCGGPLYGLGGGIKIDVRNYASRKVQERSGWYSTIRLINNNEVNTLTVYGQLIQADGSYGPWGELAVLPPRAVANLPAAVVDSKLINPPASPANGSSDPAVAGDYGVNGSDPAPRLRITAEGGGSLRVQNLLFNSATNQFLEASGSQGVDFDGPGTRSPDVSQELSEDAQAGLNGKN
jgi:hypothetical protein